METWKGIFIVIKKIEGLARDSGASYIHGSEEIETILIYRN